MPLPHILLALLVTLIWGVNFVVIKVGLHDFPPLLFCALRFALAALPLATLRGFSAAIGKDVHSVLTLEGSVASRNHPGGTAPAQVRAAVRDARKRLKG